MLPLEDLSLPTVMRERGNLADIERRGSYCLFCGIVRLTLQISHSCSRHVSAFNDKLPPSLIVTELLELTDVCGIN